MNTKFKQGDKVKINNMIVEVISNELHKGVSMMANIPETMLIRDVKIVAVPANFPEFINVGDKMRMEESDLLSGELLAD